MRCVFASLTRLKLSGLNLPDVLRAIVFSMASLGAAGATAQSAATEDCAALRDISVVLSVVTEQFYDKRFNGLNWSAEVAAAIEATQCSDNPRQVVERVNQLLSRLDASHTALYSQDDLDYWGLNSLFHFDGLDAYTLPFAGVWATATGDRWFARHVLNGSAAESAGIKEGDELISLNGEPYNPVGFVAGINRLQVSSDAQTVREITVDAPVQSVMRAFVDASAASARVLDLQAIGKRIAYYRIWAARDQIQRDFQNAMDGFAEEDIDALIVDLRGGFGGTSEDYLSSVRFMRAQKPVPVFFLIDDSVRSGKELLAAIVKRDKLGTLVGSNSAGYYLSGRMNRLLDERYFLYVAVGTFPTPGTGEIEGVGVAPDIEVAPCQQHCNGSDPILDRVLQLIIEQPDSAALSAQ
ncbi:MAG: S41 family peptidase [Pseudohongiella sp.]|nr:S41 family peptidase [Pseudohongiella sp.]